MENESPPIKPLILQNAPDKKNLNQTALMLGKNGVCDNLMKEPKSGVIIEVTFELLELQATRLPWLS